MDLNEARKLKELERENSELKKMLAEALLKNRVLEAVARKKMVGPAHRRQAAHAVVKRGLCSGRAACRILRLSRATFWYQARPPTPTQQRLAKRLRVLSEKHPRYGYRRIAALLRQEGWPVGKRHIQRLRRADELRVPPTKRKVVRRGVSTGLPTKATHRSHVWTWDFISDATVRGGVLKMLTILDEHPRECHVLRPERALRAADGLAWLERAIKEHGAPAFLRSDNGPEFIAKEIQRWLADNETARQTWLRQPGALCGAEPTSCFVRRSSTEPPNPTTYQPRFGRTLRLARKGGSRQHVAFEQIESEKSPVKTNNKRRVLRLVKGKDHGRR